MIRIVQQLYFNWRFYMGLLVVIVLFLLSYSFVWLFPIAQGMLGLFLALTVFDVVVLFMSKGKIEATRNLSDRLSLGDDNTIELVLKSSYKMPVNTRVMDELPDEFQVRNNEEQIHFIPGSTERIVYDVKPVRRGVYKWKKINVYVSTVLNFAERRYRLGDSVEAGCYPSIKQMKRQELKVFSKTAVFHGIKKIRRLGNNNEFEQIKNYVQGDDYRSVNWKATSRRGEVMVNQYQDERSQQVYCLVDKSRSMRLPFKGMTLLDYSINATLSISNIILRKGDKAGLITFSDKLGARVVAERNSGQLSRIMEVLYRQKTRFLDPNVQRLYYGTRNYIKGRSLLLLFTNFESMYAMERSISIFRRLNRQHLLVVIFFENTELKEQSRMEPENVSGIYKKTISAKFALEKQAIVRELSKYGIQSILSRPEDLSVDVINKYLEIKSRGML
ncbi:MAG TPA: DUF58 domain-containing protein [Flavobacteriales bacterium]|nr:DUF58 domain-containing protein [Crocinitomicaceae bacterium]HAE29923.1 DUF58 domain-containing protein [Flavobacteriales bacterium]|tara:strand:+ start:681 stop:2015 length:1335 start_codon:yes stop_codon:yes gene_type:complete